MKPIGARPSKIREAIRIMFKNKVPAPGDDLYWSGTQGENAHYLVRLLEALDLDVVEETLSDADLAAWNFAVAALENAVTTWRLQPAHQLRLEPNSPITAHPVAQIYYLLEKCPDSPSPKALPTLKFISDATMAKAIADDIQATERLLAKKEWKAATVIAGSIIEAILLDQLEKDEPKAKAAFTNAYPRKPLRDVEDWKLYEIIAVARVVGVIDDRERSACDVARDYRNLIHPAVVRATAPCSLGTAYQAYSAVQLLLEKLS